jgi:transposase
LLHEAITSSRWRCRYTNFRVFLNLRARSVCCWCELRRHEQCHSMETMVEWAPGPCLRVVSAVCSDGAWLVKAVGSGVGRCPNCRRRSRSRHSAYIRRLQDLPVQGATVRLELALYRLRCRNPSCGRKTFAEPLGSVAERFARRTNRVQELAGWSVMPRAVCQPRG